MSSAASVNERLARLPALGTSIWLDQIERGLVEGGELARLVREDSLRGMTSNPAIFEKAILGSDHYDEQIQQLVADDADAREIYQAVAIRDVQKAADVLRSAYDATGGPTAAPPSPGHPRRAAANANAAAPPPAA